MRGKFPVCMDARTDCFARTKYGKCDCLNDTDFKGWPCPFYKPESEMPYDRMIEKYMEERDEDD